MTASEFAARLRRRERLIGYWSVLDCPVAHEWIAHVGYDYLALDLQHGLIGYSGMVAGLTAIDAAELPELRAVEALGIVIALFLAAFSGVYLTMSHHLAANFSIPLNQTKALYFTITVFSTVGFGSSQPLAASSGNTFNSTGGGR